MTMETAFAEMECVSVVVVPSAPTRNSAVSFVRQATYTGIDIAGSADERGRTGRPHREKAARIARMKLTVEPDAA